jgi:hypothetical protein
MRTLPLCFVAAAMPLLAGLAACAATPESEASAASADATDCFRAGQVSSFTPEGRNTVFLRVGANRVYRAEILGVCPDINWSQRIAIEARGSGSWICRGIDTDLIVPSQLGIQRCPLSDLHRLGDEEARVWRRRQ